MRRFKIFSFGLFFFSSLMLGFSEVQSTLTMLLSLFFGLIAFIIFVLIKEDEKEEEEEEEEEEENIMAKPL